MLDQAIIHGRLRQDMRRTDNNLASIESASFYLRMPEVSIRDQRANAIAVRSIGTALKDAVTNGFIATEEAQRIFKRYLGMSGIDSDKDDPKDKRGQGADYSLSDLFQTTTETTSSNGYAYFESADPVSCR